MERVEEVRVVYRGMTQVARRLGVSRPWLSYVLHGRRKPSKELARKLEKLGFKVSG